MMEQGLLCPRPVPGQVFSFSQALAPGSKFPATYSIPPVKLTHLQLIPSSAPQYFNPGFPVTHCQFNTSPMLLVPAPMLCL